MNCIDELPLSICTKGIRIDCINEFSPGANTHPSKINANRSVAFINKLIKPIRQEANSLHVSHHGFELPGIISSPLRSSR